MRAEMTGRFYLDANAGAPLLAEARAAMVDALGSANPSSVHFEGRAARAIVETARRRVAAAVGARPGGVIFTSGATEAAALALSPLLRRGKETVRASHLYVGATEHPCVLAGGRFAGESVTALPVKPSGVIDLDALGAALAAHDRDSGVPLVALMLANNESGVLHPVAAAARLVRSHGGLVFCDAVQGLGRVAIDIEELGVDFLSVSAHKIGGPQGAGALVLADEDVRPAPLLAGGGQEFRRRAGTENVAAIAGFGVAAERAIDHLLKMDRIAALRDSLEKGLAETAPDVYIAGRGAPRLANTSLFAVPGVAAETAVIAFDLAGIAVSAGSACSSGKMQASHVLAAMGAGASHAAGGIRASLAAGAGAEEIEAFLAAWRGIHARMGSSRAA